MEKEKRVGVVRENVRYLVRQTGHFVRPEVLGADGVVRIALGEKVLEEAHVLEGEEGDLVLWLLVLAQGCFQLSGKGLLT